MSTIHVMALFRWPMVETEVLQGEVLPAPHQARHALFYCERRQGEETVGQYKKG